MSGCFGVNPKPSALPAMGCWVVVLMALQGYERGLTLVVVLMSLQGHAW